MTKNRSVPLRYRPFFVFLHTRTVLIAYLKVTNYEYDNEKTICITHNAAMCYSNLGTDFPGQRQQCRPLPPEVKQGQSQNRKLIKDGQLIIKANGKIYNAAGVPVDTKR